MPDPEILVENPWRILTRFTDARIGLGRVGVSLPTRELLAFQLAHAQARDAVHLPLDFDRLEADLAASDAIAALGKPGRARTKASDRDTYLRNPGMGEKLHPESAKELDGHAEAPDLALVVADGLSSLAVQQNAVPFLDALLAAMESEGLDRPAAPVLVAQGRVAIGDDVGALLGAKAVLVLIGERPGLSSPDSLGLYFTWAPETGLSDARRNCISNVRPGGLSPDRAAKRAVYLMREAHAIGASGVALKDRSTEDTTIEAAQRSFLAPPERDGQGT